MNGRMLTVKKASVRLFRGLLDRMLDEFIEVLGLRGNAIPNLYQ